MDLQYDVCLLLVLTGPFLKDRLLNPQLVCLDLLSLAVKALWSLKDIRNVTNSLLNETPDPVGPDSETVQHVKIIRQQFCCRATDYRAASVLRPSPHPTRSVFGPFLIHQRADKLQYSLCVLHWLHCSVHPLYTPTVPVRADTQHFSRIHHRASRKSPTKQQHSIRLSYVEVRLQELLALTAAAVQQRCTRSRWGMMDDGAPRETIAELLRNVHATSETPQLILSTPPYKYSEVLD